MARLTEAQVRALRRAANPGGIGIGECATVTRPTAGALIRHGLAERDPGRCGIRVTLAGLRWLAAHLSAREGRPARDVMADLVRFHPRLGEFIQQASAERVS